MNLDDIKQILDLVREHDLAELEIERDGLKVRVRKASAAAPAQHVVMVPPSTPMVPPQPLTAAPAGPASDSGGTPAAPMGHDGVDLAVVKSPIVGTLYRSSEPGAPPFVEVGTMVKKGQVLCIIEAMKLMNEIESDRDGEVTAAYVENGQPVQFGDRLFALKVS